MHQARAALSTTLHQFGTPRACRNDDPYYDERHTVRKPRLSIALMQRLEDVNLESLEHLFMSRNIWTLRQVYTLDQTDKMTLINKACTILNAYGFLGIHDLKSQLTALLDEDAYLQTFTREVASSTKHDESSIPQEATQSTPQWGPVGVLSSSQPGTASVGQNGHWNRDSWNANLAWNASTLGDPFTPGLVPSGDMQASPLQLLVPTHLQHVPTALQQQQAGFSAISTPYQQGPAGFSAPFHNLPDPPVEDCTWCLKRLKGHLHF